MKKYNTVLLALVFESLAQQAKATYQQSLGYLFTGTVNDFMQR